MVRKRHDVKIVRKRNLKIVSYSNFILCLIRSILVRKRHAFLIVLFALFVHVAFLAPKKDVLAPNSGVQLNDLAPNCLRFSTKLMQFSTKVKRISTKQRRLHFTIQHQNKTNQHQTETI